MKINRIHLVPAMRTRATCMVCGDERVELLKVTTPAFDELLKDCFAAGLAEAEDVAMHATSTLSVDTPQAIMSANVTTIKAAGGSLNGGAVSYTDLLAVLQKAVDLKIKPPYAWFLNGRTAIRSLTLYDTTSRPLFDFSPTGIGPAIGHMFGWPVYATASIPVNEAVGSGSNQSHLIFCNPSRSIHIAESGDIDLLVSDEFLFDSADACIRVGHKVDFGYSPVSSLIALTGIN
jgi:HK97 family phage major capsid protein